VGGFEGIEETQGFFLCIGNESTVLPRGRNFGRKTKKGPTKIVWRRENLRLNFWQIYQKRAKKGPTFSGLKFS
jgi:hypothetical protein